MEASCPFWKIHEGASPNWVSDTLVLVSMGFEDSHGCLNMSWEAWN